MCNDEQVTLQLYFFAHLPPFLSVSVFLSQAISNYQLLCRINMYMLVMEINIYLLL